MMHSGLLKKKQKQSRGHKLSKESHFSTEETHKQNGRTLNSALYREQGTCLHTGGRQVEGKEEERKVRQTESETQRAKEDERRTR